ncbi:hypothetical protein HMN09_00366600 [Mycena chlorophos]|uniref:BTB domain-containing protein n=1 Tax=Mycena chlorophos TaxID=658473 RepID=A0A8H6TIX8_MYCCL|nr:hypothetical protein HMN09_00366600 [Mycena chlorophos]
MHEARSTLSTLEERIRLRPVPSTWTRHPRLYLPNGRHTFIICEFDPQTATESGTLYRFSAENFELRSDFWKAIFSLPRQNDLPAEVLNEGLIPTDPIIIPREITKDMFEAYLIYLLLGPPDHPLSNTFLINLLHICDMFGTPDGLEYVRQKFADRNLVAHDPAFVFYLAHRYHMADWIGPAFEMLLKREPADLSARDSGYIGEFGLRVLYKTHGKIAKLRKRFAYTPPAYRSDLACEKRERCHDAWDSFWGKIILPYIHHPDYPIALADIPSFLAPPEHRSQHVHFLQAPHALVCG